MSTPVTLAARRVHDLLSDGVERVTRVIVDDAPLEDAHLDDVEICMFNLRAAGAAVQRRIVTFPSGDRHYAYRMTAPARGME